MSVAIVTGGSRGIGAAVVDQLARDGMAVACTATSKARAKAVADAGTGRHGRACLAIELRVEDPDSVRGAFETVRHELGSPTVLVNNAGMTNVAPLLDAD